MSDRAAEQANILPLQMSEGKVEDRHASAVPSASILQGLDAPIQEDGLVIQHAQALQPLSPLTLGELGLQPPETPSALIDITPSTASIAQSSTSLNDRCTSDRAHLSRHSTSHFARLGGADADSSFGERKQTVNTSHLTSGMASTDSSANGPSESIADPLLAKFLQSLVDDGSTLTETTPTSTSYSHPESSLPSLLPTSTTPWLASVPDRFPSDRGSSPLRMALMQRTSVANTSSTRNDHGQLSVHNARYMDPCSSTALASEPIKGTTTCGDAKSQSSSHPLWQSSHRSTLPECQLNFKPSERCHTSPKKGKRPASSGLEGHIHDLSRKEQQPGPSSRPPWTLDLASLSHLALPQAPPLQPLHRYPSQILETDGRYDSDRDMDRDSESGYQLGASPSRIEGVNASSKSANADISTTELFSSDLAIELSDSDSRASATCSISLQKNADGSRTADCTPTLAKTSKPADRLDPAPDMVRDRSGPISPRAASEASNEKGCPPARTTSASKGKPTTVAIDVPPSKGSQRSPTSQDRSASGTSSSFTRKVLFDFIRRTNLQRPVSPSSSGTTARSSSDSFPRSADTSPADSLSKKSSRPLSSSWPSAVPAELQAHLQNWQQQRKRSKPSAASQDEAAASSSSAHARRAQAGKISPPAQKERKEAPSNARRAVDSEQEKKTQRQEQYQRLLQRLQAQMRSSMQRERDKKRQNNQEMSMGGDDEKRETRDVQERDWKQDSIAKMDSHGHLKTASELLPEALGSKTKPPSSKRSSDDAGLLSRSNQKNTRPSHDTRDEAHTPADQLQEVVLNQVAGSASTLAIGPSDVSIPVGRGPRATDEADAERTLSPQKPVGTARPIESPYLLPTSSYPQCLQTDPHPTWGHPPALHLRGVEWNHPWMSTPFGAAAYPGTPPMSGPPAWMNGALSGALGCSHSPELMQALVMKHPNWRQDFRGPMAPAIVARESYPTMPALSKGPLETGLSSVFASCIDPRTISCLSTAEATAPLSAAPKRPFSPGERVVFWAIKGTASVKLKGVVESMTDDSADITVETASGESLREQNAHAGGTGTQAFSHPEPANNTCVYRNISWGNIVPRQQAIALRFLRADE